MKDGQRSHDLGFTVKRKGINVQGLVTQFQVGLAAFVLGYCLLRDRGNVVGKLGREARRHGQRLPSVAVNGHAVQPLAVSKLLNQSLQSLGWLFFENRLDDFFQTLRQYLRAPRKIVPQPQLLRFHLATSEEERDRGNANNQPDD